MVAPLAVNTAKLPEQMEEVLILKVGVFVTLTVLVATEEQEPIEPVTV